MTGNLTERDPHTGAIAEESMRLTYDATTDVAYLSFRATWPLTSTCRNVDQETMDGRCRQRARPRSRASWDERPASHKMTGARGALVFADATS